MMTEQKRGMKLVRLPADVFLLLVIAAGLLGFAAGMLLGAGKPAGWETMAGSAATVVAMIRLVLWTRQERLENMGLSDD